ncbi:MAG TPA: hypothetical protein VMU83_05110 [Hanamia sp.]|nr:hypothetical protein [Hanamia sp.]
MKKASASSELQDAFAEHLEVEEKELMVMYENALKYLKSDSGKNKTSENNSLPNYQTKELDETIKQGSSDENKKDKELKKSIARWFSDGGKNPG